MKKCPYCDFNSHERRGDVPEAQYVDALIADLESALPSIWGRRVETVFFGGGTPSLFSAVAIDRILAAVRARVPLSPDAEVTLEVIRAPSSRTSSRTSRQPASIACRWVCKLRS
jgi:oxygen-independent coproporphyrinogen-3 oxidase